MPTFDAASSGQSATSPLTVPHTVGAGDDPALVSTVLVDSTTGDVAAITAGGVAMVQHAEVAVIGGELQVYKLAAPAQGSPLNVVITATAPHFIMAINLSALGADQKDILRAAFTASGFSASVGYQIPNVEMDDLVMDAFLAITTASWSPTAFEQTQRGIEIWAAEIRRMHISTRSGTYDGWMSWTSALAANWYALAAAIKAVTLRPRQAITLKEV